MQERLRFGRFEVRPKERVLLVEGRAAKLGSRAFDLLVALIERRDRLVTKDELLEVVWVGRVVEENNLAVHLSALRKLIGADAIKTAPGYGYRFVAPSSDDAPAGKSTGQIRLGDPGKLPSSIVSLLGRDADLADLESLWAQSRCITLIGAAGIGKSALARAAVQTNRSLAPDGAAWVDLAEVSDDLRVTGAVAQAVGFDAGHAADPLPALIEALRAQRMLLVLDNAEQVRAPVARFARAVLEGAIGVRLLITSQAPLKMDGEQVFRLGPLAIPDDTVGAATALDYGAVALFVQQARAADRRFSLNDSNVPMVIALCRHLDGVPLALKLAASRLPLLGLAGLLSRLGDRLSLLRNGERDLPLRQQALLAALDWSHGLLAEGPRAVFRRLAVFSGGFPLEMLSPVTCDAGIDEATAIDALAELVDRSIANTEAREGELFRYRLPETARVYARLRLEEAGEAGAVQERHAQAVARWMGDAYDSYWSMPDRPWLDRCAPEIDNVRAALDWAAGAQPALALGLAASAGVLFMLLGQAPEARRRLARLEPAARACDTGPALARYWLERSRLEWGVANHTMLEFAELAVLHYRRLGDARGLALALRCAIGSGALDDDAAAGAQAEMASLVPANAAPRLRAQRLLAQACALQYGGRPAEACQRWGNLLALTSSEGLDGMATAALAGLASARLASGDAAEALSCARRLLADPRARRGNFLLHPLGTMAEAHLVLGELALARQVLVDFAATSRIRDWEWLSTYAGVFALLAACEGRLDAAARLLGYADRVAPLGIRGRTSAHLRAHAAVERDLDPSILAHCKAEGSSMDEASVCALALGEPIPLGQVRTSAPTM